MRPRALTGAKLARFRKLCREKLPNHEIRKRLGVSRFTVTKYRKSLGFEFPARRTLTPEDVHTLVNSPEPIRRLALNYHVSERTIRQLRDQHILKAKFACDVCGKRALERVHPTCAAGIGPSPESNFWE